MTSTSYNCILCRLIISKEFNTIKFDNYTEHGQTPNVLIL